MLTYCSVSCILGNPGVIHSVSTAFRCDPFRTTALISKFRFLNRNCRRDPFRTHCIHTQGVNAVGTEWITPECSGYVLDHACGSCKGSETLKSMTLCRFELSGPMLSSYTYWKIVTAMGQLKLVWVLSLGLLAMSKTVICFLMVSSEPSLLAETMY